VSYRQKSTSCQPDSVFQGRKKQFSRGKAFFSRKKDILRRGRLAYLKRKTYIPRALQREGAAAQVCVCVYSHAGFRRGKRSCSHPFAGVVFGKVARSIPYRAVGATHALPSLRRRWFIICCSLSIVSCFMRGRCFSCKVACRASPLIPNS
jgi:hypothetical protein